MDINSLKEKIVVKSTSVEENASKRAKFGWLLLFLIFVVGSLLRGPDVGISRSLSGLIGILDAEGEVTESIVEGSANEKIAIINIDGVILNDENYSYYDGVANVADLRRIFDYVLADENIKAVLLDIDSPGGSVAASDELYQMVRSLQNAEKKVIAYFGEIATSGAYYLSAPSDKIVISRGSLTGSIGVILQTYNYQKLLENIGVEVVTFKSGKYKDILDPSRPVTKEEKEIMEGIVKESYDEFLAIVKEGRKLSDEELNKVADGRIFTAKQAVKNKLADSMGSKNDAINESKKLIGVGDATVVELEVYQNWLSDIFGYTGLSFKSLLSKAGLDRKVNSGLYYLWTP